MTSVSTATGEIEWSTPDLGIRNESVRLSAREDSGVAGLWTDRRLRLFRVSDGAMLTDDVQVSQIRPDARRLDAVELGPEGWVVRIANRWYRRQVPYPPTDVLRRLEHEECLTGYDFDGRLRRAADLHPCAE